MSETKKILKRLTFTYRVEDEVVDPTSIFGGYYKNVKVSEQDWIMFYNTLNKEQKTLLLKLWR